MRVALSVLIFLGLAASTAACHKQEAPPLDQNIAVDGGNIPENADIEELPPDESSGDSANELESGTDNPDVNDVNASTNGY